MDTAIASAGLDGTVSSRFGRQGVASLKVTLINAALVAAPVLFVLVEAAGRRMP